MIQTRLELICPEMRKRLDSATQAQLRRVAAVVSRTIVERVGLSHPLIAEALAQLSISASPDPGLRLRVQALAEELDAKYLDLKQPYEQRADAGKIDPQVIITFSEARAASSVAMALHDDALVAASEATYEAASALDDAVKITTVAEKTLSEP